jgi:hypothetical protein
MFSNNHHKDGHVAVMIPAPPGHQEAMIAAEPKKFYRPPYVGVKGWVGIEMREIDDEELGALILEGWRLITAKKGRRG